MKQILNIYLDKRTDSHFDLVLVRENGEKLVLACYKERPLLLKEFKTDEKDTVQN